MSELLDIERVRALRESTNAWQMALRDAPRRCDPAGYYRLAIIVSPGANSIRYMAPLGDQVTDDRAIFDALERAMFQPGDDALPAARPPTILVDCQQLAERIGTPLQACGVSVQLLPELDAIEPVLEVLAEREGLFSQGTLLGTEVMESELAQAAAELASCEPWRIIAGPLPLAVRYSRADSRAEVTRWLFITGGSPLRLACCSELAAMLSVMHASEGGGAHHGDGAEAGWQLELEPAVEVAQRRRDAFTRRGLKCAHQLYPRFTALGARAAQRPIESNDEARDVARDLQLLSAVLREQQRELLSGRFAGCELTLASDWRAEVEVRRDLSPAMALAEPWFDDDPSQEEIVGSLIEVEHAVSLASIKPAMVALVAPQLAARSDAMKALVIRCRDQDAKPIAAKLAVVDAISIMAINEGDQHSEVVLAFRGDEVLGVLTHCPVTHDRASLLHQLAAADCDEVALVLAGRRDSGQQQLRADEIFSANLVELRSELPGPAPSTGEPPVEI